MRSYSNRCFFVFCGIRVRDVKVFFAFEKRDISFLECLTLHLVHLGLDKPSFLSLNAALELAAWPNRGLSLVEVVFLMRVAILVDSLVLRGPVSHGSIRPLLMTWVLANEVTVSLLVFSCAKVFFAVLF